MTSDADFQQKIMDELDRTGYPTELVAASMMQQRGWGVIHNPSYLVGDQPREFDIRAYRSWRVTHGTGSFTIGVYLIVECKKSKHPWVFFTSPREEDEVDPAHLIKSRSMPAHILWSDQQDRPPIVSDSFMRAQHHYFQRQRWARTYYEPFKHQETASHSSLLYGAVLSAIDAALFHYYDRSLVLQRHQAIYYPIIVFSGNLFEAEVDAAKKIQLRRAQHIQLLHHRIEPASANDRWSERSGSRLHVFLVDVVHEDYLGEFLTLVEHDHDVLAAELQGPLGQGKLEPHI